MKKTTTSTPNTVKKKPTKKVEPVDDDFFLDQIKKKGFCTVSNLKKLFNESYRPWQVKN